MSGIEIKVDTKDFSRQIALAQKEFAAIGNSRIKGAAVAALNKTGDRIVTRVRRELSAKKGVPQKYIQDKISRFKASRQRMVCRVWIGLKRGIPIEQIQGAYFHFKSGELRAGKVSVKPFRAEMPSGRKGLWVRRLPSVRQSPDRAGITKNLPIEQPTIRLQPEAQPLLVGIANEQSRVFLPSEFQRLLKLALERVKIKALEG